jgi:hypothetical protein
VGRYPDAAKKYNISDSSMSRQLPTVILFKGGKEVTRRPAVDNRGKLIKFFFSEVKCSEIHITAVVTHDLILAYLHRVSIKEYHYFCDTLHQLYVDLQDELMMMMMMM